MSLRLSGRHFIVTVTPIRRNLVRFGLLILSLTLGLVGSSHAVVGRPAAIAPPASGADLAPYFTLTQVASGLTQPVAAANAGDGSGRLFIIERAGVVRILQAGSLLSTPFLDIRSRVEDGGSEQGLLGLAFHPDYASNGRFFVHYTRADRALVIAEYAVGADPDQADANSESVMLVIPKNHTNHNGGTQAFGPDGLLYISTGDGGGGGDPGNNGQNLDSLLGKILRIDVDGASPYAVPAANPFASDGDPDTRGEIWAYGLRNPWKYAFDRASGDLWIADVGQSRQEEVNFQAAASPGGENYGWRLMEGSLCYNPSSNCNPGGLTMPVAEYSQSATGGCSVTGGYVYRGTQSPALHGIYLYGDFCSGDIWGLEPDGSGGWSSHALTDAGFLISSFAEDEAGEVYAFDYGAGGLYQVSLRSFADVLPSYWAFEEIEAIYQAGYVAGCSADPRLYCPDRILNRAESAVFVLRGEYGSIADPPHTPPATPTFVDVATSFWGYGWIESLWIDGFTAGCSADPLAYCPDSQHTRAEGSVFFLRILNAPSYEPPAPVGLFDDVDLGAWYAGWAEAAYNAGLLPACASGPLRFCPEDELDRAWAAYMLVQAKGGLPLP